MSANRPTENVAQIPGLQTRDVRGAIPSTGNRVPTAAFDSQANIGRSLQQIGQGITAATVSISGLMEQRIKARESLDASRIATEYDLGESIRSTRFKQNYSGLPENYFEADKADQSKFYDDFVKQQGGVFTRADAQQAAIASMNKSNANSQVQSYQEQYKRVQQAVYASYNQNANALAQRIYHEPTEDAYNQSVDILSKSYDQVLKTGMPEATAQSNHESSMRTLQTNYLLGIAKTQGPKKALEELNSGKYEYLDTPQLSGTLTAAINNVERENAKKVYSDIVNSKSYVLSKTLVGDNKDADIQIQSIDYALQSTGLTYEQRNDLVEQKAAINASKKIYTLFYPNGQLPNTVTDVEQLQARVTNMRLGLHNEKDAASQKGLETALDALDAQLTQMKDALTDSYAATLENGNLTEDSPASAKVEYQVNTGRKVQIIDKNGSYYKGIRPRIEAAVAAGKHEEVAALIQSVYTKYSDPKVMANGVTEGNQAVYELFDGINGLPASKVFALSLIRGSSGFADAVTATLGNIENIKATIADPKAVSKYLRETQPFLGYAQALSQTATSEGANNVSGITSVMEDMMYLEMSKNQGMSAEQAAKNVLETMNADYTVSRYKNNHILLNKGDDANTIQRQGQAHMQRLRAMGLNAAPSSDILNTMYERGLLPKTDGLAGGAPQYTIVEGQELVLSDKFHADGNQLDADGNAHRTHYGSDYKGDKMRIISPFEGKIKYAGYDPYNPKTGRGGWGNYVIVESPDGKEMLMAHLDSYDVTIGQAVSKGQFLGISGNTGKTTGPHLHAELKIDGKNVDPDPYLRGKAGYKRATTAYGLPLNDAATQLVIRQMGLDPANLSQRDAGFVAEGVLNQFGFTSATAAPVRAYVLAAYSVGGSEAVHKIMQDAGSGLSGMVNSSGQGRESQKIHINHIKNSLAAWAEGKPQKAQLTSMLADFEKKMFKDNGVMTLQLSPETKAAQTAMADPKGWFTLDVNTGSYVFMSRDTRGKIFKVNGVPPMTKRDMETVDSIKAAGKEQIRKTRAASGVLSIGL